MARPWLLRSRLVSKSRPITRSDAKPWLSFFHQVKVRIVSPGSWCCILYRGLRLMPIGELVTMDYLVVAGLLIRRVAAWARSIARLESVTCFTSESIVRRSYFVESLLASAGSSYMPGPGPCDIAEALKFLEAMVLAWVVGLTRSRLTLYAPGPSGFMSCTAGSFCPKEGPLLRLTPAVL